jgi:hypothetical protein
MTSGDVAVIVASSVAGGVALVLAVVTGLVLWQNRRLVVATQNIITAESAVNDMVTAVVKEAGAIAEQAQAATEAVRNLQRDPRHEPLPPERARQFTAQMHVLDEITRIVREPTFMATAVAFHEDQRAREEAQNDATAFFRRRGVTLPANADGEASDQRLTLRVDSPSSMGAVRACVWYDIQEGWGWSVTALPGRAGADQRTTPPWFTDGDAIGGNGPGIGGRTASDPMPNPSRGQ